MAFIDGFAPDPNTSTGEQMSSHVIAEQLITKMCGRAVKIAESPAAWPYDAIVRVSSEDGTFNKYIETKLDKRDLRLTPSDFVSRIITPMIRELDKRKSFEDWDETAKHMANCG